MAKTKWTKMSRSHLIKLIYRSTLFLSALIYFLVSLITGHAKYGEKEVLFVSSYSEVPVFLIIMCLVFITEMVFRFFPNKHESIGNQKAFKSNYIKSKGAALGQKPQNQHFARTLLVLGAWVTLNGIIGALYIFKIISADVMVLISLAYSVCDLICIMFFCPFQAWMMKNKCCATCRIYNWDYPMMFTPLLFLILRPGVYLHYVLIFGAFVVLLFWEITRRAHPERFAENTNERLSCKHCTEKTCHHNCCFPNKKAIAMLHQNSDQKQEIKK